MSGRNNSIVTLGLVVSVSLIVAVASTMLTSGHCSRIQYHLLNAVCGEILEQEPGARNIILTALREYKDGNDVEDTKGRKKERIEEDVLAEMGYRRKDFSDLTSRQDALSAGAAGLIGVSLFFMTFFYRNQKEARRIHALADYLEQVNTGKAVILSASGEDDFSKLEDEIYKTVTFLFQTREAAVQAKNDFAENLSNIAHQIKTPITALSLSVQMMKQELVSCAASKALNHPPGQIWKCENCPDHHPGQVERQIRKHESCLGHHLGQVERQIRKHESCLGHHLGQVEKQILRLAHLEETLLVLSRIDAGTILLQKNEIDVFTVLVLAADNLQELFAGSGTSIDIPELGEMKISADLDWTMEAVMNLMKNCMEHSKGGTVHCSYAQNPLYTEIQIWDDGEGFAEEDLPHLFERFYRGQNAGEGGIGIGLALSKEVIERQNGTIRAKNKPDGGALFVIRFYSH